jgi:DNA primase
MAKFCTKCGAENKDAAKFCKECGSELSSASEGQASAGSETEPATAQNAQPVAQANADKSFESRPNNDTNKSPGKFPAIAVVTGVAIVAVLAGGMFYLGHKSQSAMPSAQSSSPVPQSRESATPASKAIPAAQEKKEESHAQLQHSQVKPKQHKHEKTEQKTASKVATAPASARKSATLDSQSESMLNIAQNLMDSNDYSGAKNLADQVLQKYPHNQRARSISNKCAAEIKKKEDAIRKHLGF